jgi:hypothetical protein
MNRNVLLAKSPVRFSRLFALLAVCVLVGEATVWFIAGTYFNLFSSFPWADNLATKWSLVLGYALTYSFILQILGKQRNQLIAESFCEASRLKSHSVAKGLAVGLVIYEVLYITLGGLSARETVGNLLTAENSLYWLRAVEGYPILASLYLYAYITRESYVKKTTLYWPVAAIIGAYCLLLLASGGRGGTMILLSAIVLSEIARSGIKTVLTSKVTYLGILIALAAFYVVGELRTFADYSTPSERMKAFLEQRSATSESTIGDAIEKTMFRLSELYGHVVINRSIEGEVSMPFLNVERLFLTMVPAAFVPSKQPLDDGPENLALYFGFGSEISEFKSLPITLQADLFWRFGYLGPLVGGLIVGGLSSGWLLAIFRTKLLAHQCDVLIAYLAVHLLKLYPSSVLGVIGILTYKLLRDVIIFGFILTILDSLAKKKRKQLASDLATSSPVPT